MKILLDACVGRQVARLLSAFGHEVESVSNWERDPGDQEILNQALRERQVLVTLDKDFGELAVVRGQPHAGIVRLVGFSHAEQGEACLGALLRFADELARAAIVTVARERIRVRPAAP